MRLRVWFPLIAVILALVLPTVAGEKGYKCTASTQDCLNEMAKKMKSSGWIGVDLDKDKYPAELVVTHVFAGSPAEAAGIQPGDILYALDGVRIAEENKQALKKVRSEWKPGQQVTYTIKRSGVEKKIALTLAPMPADIIARVIGEHMLEHATPTEMAAK